MLDLDAVTRLYILLTGEVFQDMYLRANREQPQYLYFFLLFTLIGIFGWTPVLFATVWDFFRRFFKEQIAKERKKTRHALTQAFAVLDTSNTGAFGFQTWCMLYSELVPEGNWNDALLRFDLMDHDKNDEIDPVDFLTVDDVLALVIHAKDSGRWKCVRCVPNCLVRLQTKLISVDGEFKERWESWSAIPVHIMLFLNLLQHPSLSGNFSGLGHLILVGQLCLALGTGTELSLYVWLGGIQIRGRHLFSTFDLLEVDVMTNVIAIVMAALCVNGVLAARYSWVAPTLMQLRLIRSSRVVRSSFRILFGVLISVFPLVLLITVTMHAFATLGVATLGRMPDQCANDDRREAWWFDTFHDALTSLYQVALVTDWNNVMDQTRICLHGKGAVLAWTDWYFILFVFWVQMILVNLLTAMIAHGYFSMRSVVARERFRVLVNLHDTTTTIRVGSKTPKTHVRSVGCKTPNLRDIRSNMPRSPKKARSRVDRHSYEFSGLVASPFNGPAGNGTGSSSLSQSKRDFIDTFHQVHAEDDLKQEWIIQKRHFDWRHDMVKDEDDLNFISEKEYESLNKIARVNLQDLRELKSGSCLKDVESDKLIDAVAQFAQSELDEQQTDTSHDFKETFEEAQNRMADFNKRVIQHRWECYVRCLRNPSALIEGCRRHPASNPAEVHAVIPPAGPPAPLQSESPVQDGLRRHFPQSDMAEERTSVPSRSLLLSSPGYFNDEGNRSESVSSASTSSVIGLRSVSSSEWLDNTPTRVIIPSTSAFTQTSPGRPS